MPVSSPNRKGPRSLVSRSGEGSLNLSSPASISSFWRAAVANCVRPRRPRKSLNFSKSASISSFWRAATACWACRALPRRPQLVEGCGEPGVGPGGVISGVISGVIICFGEEVLGPVACLLLLTVVACHLGAGGHTGAGGFFMAPDDCLVLEHHMDPAAFAIFDRLSAFVTSSSAALAPWTRLS